MILKKNQNGAQKSKVLIPGKILNKTRPNFWGVTDTTPLKKNLVLEIC